MEVIKEINPVAKVVLGRELTKIFEEVLIDEVENLLEHFSKNPPKGEFVGMVYRAQRVGDDVDVDEKIKLLKSKKFGAKDISVILSTLYGVNKNEIYKKVVG